jgi:uncharacterized protein (TIGR00369 family)
VDFLQQRLATTRADAHPACIACGGRNGRVPRVQFVPAEDGAVEATVLAGHAYEGYSGMVHGGVIATLLDAAMTNCLFAQGFRAVTADLHVRYRHPVMSGEACKLRAHIERAAPPLFVLRAELWQSTQLRVTATGKFMKVPDGDARRRSE